MGSSGRASTAGVTLAPSRYLRASRRVTDRLPLMSLLESFANEDSSASVRVGRLRAGRSFARSGAGRGSTGSEASGQLHDSFWSHSAVVRSAEAILEI